jgi:hypothetical protein
LRHKWIIWCIKHQTIIKPGDKKICRGSVKLDATLLRTVDLRLLQAYLQTLPQKPVAWWQK